MRKFKMIDFWVNAVLIPLCVFIALLKMDETIIDCYAIVGMWQIFSILVHHYKNWFVEKGRKRRYYTIAVIIILLSVFVPFVNMFVFYTLLFAAPLMACYYAWICYNEVYVKMRRPLSLLR